MYTSVVYQCVCVRSKLSIDDPGGHVGRDKSPTTLFVLSVPGETRGP